VGDCGQISCDQVLHSSDSHQTADEVRQRAGAEVSRDITGRLARDATLYCCMFIVVFIQGRHFVSVSVVNPVLSAGINESL